MAKIKRALISVTEKSGVVEFAKALSELGVDILSTGGTAKVLRESGVRVTDVSEYTGFPEMLDGRVKTLHPAIHGGLLARRDAQEHMEAIAARGIAPIDLIVVNLYPFEAALHAGADRDVMIENIDIGGPAMIRSAAKNHDHVAVVTDPADYAAVIAELDANRGATTRALRRRLAATAFAATAAYDGMIASWFAFADQGDPFPATLPLVGDRKSVV